MGRLQKLLLTLVAGTLLCSSAEATAVFARQYDMKCSGCHIGLPPALNATGQKFYRAGFKFSKGETTTMRKALDGDLVPVSIMVGARYKHGDADLTTPKGVQKMEVRETDPTFKIMSSGAINDNFAYFVGAKFAYMNKDGVDGAHRTLEMEGRKAYIMYTDNERHNVRVGSMSPYAQLGNIKRSVESSGINPAMHTTPLDRAGVNNRIFGVDYSYKSKSGLGMLLSAGRITEQQTELIGEERMNYVAGLDYYNDDNFRVSALAVHTATEDKNVYADDRTVYMIPMEYSINNEIFINPAFVYEAKNTSAGINNRYAGFEISTSYQFMENALVRGIFSTDNDNSKTYALKYSQMFADHVMIGLNAAKTKTNSPVNPKLRRADATSLSAAISIVY